MPDISDVLDERGSRYGDYYTHAQISQDIQKILRDGYELAHPGQTYWELPPDIRESLSMISHKLARIVNGDPLYHDSHTDIAGYAKLVADRLEND